MRMTMWTVYDHPKDFPHGYLARAWTITPGESRPTTRIIVAPDLEAIRDVLRSMHLDPIARQPKDDPVIVEVWL